MKTHHTSLYNDDNNQQTVPVLRQELITWVETDFGLVKTTMTRTFADDDGKAFTVGNAGAESVTPIMSENGISFIEVTSGGSVQTTAVDWSGSSSHSRNMLLDSGLVPSQYYGKCVIK